MTRFKRVTWISQTRTKKKAKNRSLQKLRRETEKDVYSGEKIPASDDWNLVKRLKFSLAVLEIDISESTGVCEDKEESSKDLR